MIRSALAALLVPFALVISQGSAEAADTGSPNRCPAFDSDQVRAPGPGQELTVKAPRGKRISGYCVKTRYGLETRKVRATKTLTIRADANIRHYSLTYRPHYPYVICW